MATTIEAFMEEKVLPEYRPVVQAFRDLIKKVAPEVTEGMRGGTEKYYSVPVYLLKRDIIVISPTKKRVNFAFSKGAHFADKYGLLKGGGRTNSNVFVKSMDDFNEEALADYIRQAVTIDSQT